jgi:hypothetical protein
MEEDFFQVNEPPKQTRIVLISGKRDFKPKLVRRDKEGHLILIKGTIHQEEIAVVNIYTSNVGVPNFIKQTLLDLQAQTDPQHNNSGGLQCPTLTNRQIIQIKYQ